MKKFKMMEKSKAQLKREKQTREQLVNQIGKLLVGFQDRYLGASVEWEEKKILKEISNYEQLKVDEPKRLAQAIRDEEVGNVSKWKGLSHDRTWLYDRRIKELNSTLEFKSIFTLRHINEAKKGYDFKFNRMVDKLMQYEQFSNERVYVEFVGDAGHELTFLIKCDSIECHARAIFVCGEIKAPHYRFITTIRKRK